MHRRELLAAPGALVLAAAGEKPAASAPNTNADNRLDGILHPYLAQYGLPAVTAAVVRDGRLIAAGAIGTRRIGSDIPVTINDRFHIGSDTKAMTALLAAMLVEAGKLRWDATVGAIFPELVATMAAGVAGITLEQLLSHTSGISSDNPAQDKLIEQSFAQPGNLDELRYWILTGLVKESLQSKPGGEIRLFEPRLHIGRRHHRAGRRKELGRADRRAHL
jgi:CubicO group peptidase (beta-lactamase class C family)